MTAVRVCLVGLPEAGKSSYIASLWAYLAAGPTGDSYRITGFPEQVAYLKELADKWFLGEKLDRNVSGTVKAVEFELRAEHRQDLEISVPDLPGEEFKHAVTFSRIDEDIAEMVLAADVVLFFVNAHDARTFEPLADIPPAADSGQEVHIDFDPADLDSDLLNSSLLQQLLYLWRDRQRLPVVIVLISAWDLCTASGMTPPEWVFDVQPMFAQALGELDRRTQTEIFGVSAQGADYGADPSIIETPPLQRVYMVSADGTKVNDITQPFAWFDDLGLAVSNGA
jgi:hypothetical protein